MSDEEQQDETRPDEPEKPELIPQPHGGALYAGGVPGNRGGGRPPSRIRGIARKAFGERVRLLAEIADDGEESARDRIRAIDVLGRYGLGQAKGLEQEEFEAVVVGMGEALQRRLRGVLSEAEADRVLREVFEDWKAVLRAYRAAPDG